MPRPPCSVTVADEADTAGPGGGYEVLDDEVEGGEPVATVARREVLRVVGPGKALTRR